MVFQKNYLIAICMLLVGLVFYGGSAQAQERGPNILVISGDDIGQAKLRIFTKGLVGNRTPNRLDKALGAAQNRG